MPANLVDSYVSKFALDIRTCNKVVEKKNVLKRVSLVGKTESSETLEVEKR